MYKERYPRNKISDKNGAENTEGKRERSKNKWKEAENQNNRELQRS